MPSKEQLQQMITNIAIEYSNLEKVVNAVCVAHNKAMQVTQFNVLLLDILRRKGNLTDEDFQAAQDALTQQNQEAGLIKRPKSDKGSETKQAQAEKADNTNKDSGDSKEIPVQPEKGTDDAGDSGEAKLRLL